MLKIGYFSLMSVGVFFSLLTVLMVLVSISQLAKNRKVHRDFVDRVNTVADFRTREGRLPTKSEWTRLSESLPCRYVQYDFEINTTLSDVPRPPRGELTRDDWTLSFWRGEWVEYYLSWNEYNSMAWQTSLFRFGGQFMVPPLIVSMGCFLGARRCNRSLQSRFLDSVC